MDNWDVFGGIGGLAEVYGSGKDMKKSGKKRWGLEFE